MLLWSLKSQLPPPHTHAHTHTHTHTHTSQEELADWDSRNKLRSNEELAKVIAIRIFTNLLTVLMLMAGGAAIYYAALLSFTTVGKLINIICDAKLLGNIDKLAVQSHSFAIIKSTLY